MPAAENNTDALPFSFAGDRRGALLVHGYTGTPFEMRPLGEHLAKRGFSVAAPLLAGHGGSASALASTTWRDWYDSAARALDELRARVGENGKVVVIGLSLGGLLALELARQRPAELACVASLAAPLWLSPMLMRLIRWTGRSRFLEGKTVPKWGGSDIRDRAMRARNPSTDGFPVRTLVSLTECMAHVRGGLKEVERPTFIAHARQDHTAPFACLATLAEELGGPIEQLILEESFHCITIDVERELLFGKLDAFVDRHLV